MDTKRARILGSAVAGVALLAAAVGGGYASSHTATHAQNDAATTITYQLPGNEALGGGGAGAAATGGKGADGMTSTGGKGDGTTATGGGGNGSFTATGGGANGASSSG